MLFEKVLSPGRGRHSHILMLVVDGDIIAVEPELCRAATTAVAVFACTIDLCTATLGTFDRFYLFSH